ncbi:unnamed protein product [Ectocarpus sp. CCAP 1310/34]|nr:unnamed protein product [Ectocarpus sp. CCAP 1310/34]
MTAFTIDFLCMSAFIYNCRRAKHFGRRTSNGRLRRMPVLIIGEETPWTSYWTSDAIWH